MDFDKAELSRVRLKGKKILELLEWKYDFSVLKKNEQFINIYSKVIHVIENIRQNRKSVREISHMPEESEATLSKQ